MKQSVFPKRSKQQNGRLFSNTEDDNPALITNGQANKLFPEDRAFHNWYRFVLSFPPHLVANYIEKFNIHPGQTILDPFCGTGTTLVEAKLRGIGSIGLESNPFPKFASSIKVDWSIEPESLISWAHSVANSANEILISQGIIDTQNYYGNVQPSKLRQLLPEKAELLIKDSISEIPLHKTLVLLDCLNLYKSERCYKYGILALGKALVFSISNLHFGPEVGVSEIKNDSPVIAFWLSEIQKMADDLKSISNCTFPSSQVYLADSRKISQIIQPNSIDAVITSPPYPNEKDYTRTTRLESVLLGFINSSEELRNCKKQLLRSNTRNVYKDDCDDLWVLLDTEVQRIAQEIEKRRIELGKTSGFEKLYGKVTKLYFGGISRHLADLRAVLRPDAQLAYVVGDQASYLRVMIRTGQLLSDIARNLGYEVVRTDPFRTRLSTTTKEQLSEEVVVLRWPG